MSTSSSQKCLLIGASGNVGTQMLSALGSLALPTTSRGARPGWLEFNLADLCAVSEAAALFDRYDLSGIYCVGGMTWVDGCESQPDLAFRINARGPGVLAAYAYARRLPFLYLSTEYIFDGAASDPGPYTETAAPNPLSVYGKSKLEGEQRVLAAHPGALILRTTIVYGPDPGAKNYVYSLLRALSAGKEMSVPEDQVSTPTYNRDLVRAALGLTAAGATGILHVCGPELLGRLEFARMVAKKFDLPARLLKGVSTAALGQAAPRPLAAGLLTEKLQREYPNLVMRSVSASLDDCRTELDQFRNHLNTTRI
jgi:dTDP-4-dehydrorhamnose reductase